MPFALVRIEISDIPFEKNTPKLMKPSNSKMPNTPREEEILSLNLTNISLFICVHDDYLIIQATQSVAQPHLWFVQKANKGMSRLSLAHH
jgi:hypothetical protein